MPIINDARIKPMDGSVSYTLSDSDQTEGAVLEGQEGQSGQEYPKEESGPIKGRNEGTGVGLYKETITTDTSTTLLFKSIKVGHNLRLDERTNEIFIDLSDDLAKPDLDTLGGILPTNKGGTGLDAVAVNGLLIGNGINKMNVVAPPTISGQYLTYKNGLVRWEELPKDERVFDVRSNSYALLANKVAPDNTFIIDFVPGVVNLDSFQGTLGIHKGGTGLNGIGPADTVLMSDGTKLRYGNIDASNIAGLQQVAMTANYEDLTNRPRIPQGTVESVGLYSNSPMLRVTESKVTVDGDLNIEFAPDKLDINTLSGSVSVMKGGTGLKAVGDANTFLYSDGYKLGYRRLSIDDIDDKATVARTGRYDDLLDKPVLKDGTVTRINVRSASPQIKIKGEAVTTNGEFELNFHEEEINIANTAGILPVSKGGTGLFEFNNNSILVGNAQGNLSTIAPPLVGHTKTLRFDGQRIVWGDAGKNFFDTMEEGMASVSVGEFFVAPSTNAWESLVLYKKGLAPNPEVIAVAGDDKFAKDATTVGPRKGAELIGYRYNNTAVQTVGSKLDKIKLASDYGVTDSVDGKTAELSRALNLERELKLNTNVVLNSPLLVEKGFSLDGSNSFINTELLNEVNHIVVGNDERRVTAKIKDLTIVSAKDNQDVVLAVKSNRDSVLSNTSVSGSVVITGQVDEVTDLSGVDNVVSNLKVSAKDNALTIKYQDDLVLDNLKLVSEDVALTITDSTVIGSKINANGNVLLSGEDLQLSSLLVKGQVLSNVHNTKLEGKIRDAAIGLVTRTSSLSTFEFDIKNCDLAIDEQVTIQQDYSVGDLTNSERSEVVVRRGSNRYIGTISNCYEGAIIGNDFSDYDLKFNQVAALTLNLGGSNTVGSAILTNCGMDYIRVTPGEEEDVETYHDGVSVLVTGHSNTANYTIVGKRSRQSVGLQVDGNNNVINVTTDHRILITGDGNAVTVNSTHAVVEVTGNNNVIKGRFSRLEDTGNGNIVV